MIGEDSGRIREGHSSQILHDRTQSQGFEVVLKERRVNHKLTPLGLMTSMGRDAFSAEPKSDSSRLRELSLLTSNLLRLGSVGHLSSSPSPEPHAQSQRNQR